MCRRTFHNIVANMRWPRASCGYLLAWMLSTTVHAQTRPQASRATAWLRFERHTTASECTDAKALEQAVEARLSRRVFVDRLKADLLVYARVRWIDGEQAWGVRIELRTQNGALVGTRELRSEAPHCSVLKDPMALVLAVMLDVPRDELPKPQKSPRPAERAQQSQPAIELPVKPEPSPVPWRFRAGAGVTAGLGLLPGLALGVRGHASATPPGLFPLELDLNAFFESTARVSGAGAGFSALSAALYVCPLWKQLSSAFELGGCLGQHAGRLSVHPFGFDEQRQTARGFLNAGLRVVGRMRLFGPFRLRAALDAELPLIRERFRYTAPDGTSSVLFRMAPVAGFAELGLSADF